MITKTTQIAIAMIGLLALAAFFYLPELSLAMMTAIVLLQWFSHQKSLGVSKKINHPVKNYMVADSVMLINSEGIILDCNHQVLPMFGYERSEVIGKTIEFLMDPSIQKHHVGLRHMFFITSGKRRMQNRVWALHKDGHRVHIEVFLEISSINDQSNVICSIRDISRFWKREQDLLAQNRLLENTHNIGFGILHSTISGVIIMANGYISRMLSYSPDECKTLTMQEVMHAEDRHVIETTHRKLLDERAEQHTEVIRMRNASNQYIWCRFHASLVAGPDDSQVIAWVVHDISNIKALQSALDHRSFELESLLKVLSSKGEAVWIANPGMTRILYSNAAFLEQWGLKESQLNQFLDKAKQQVLEEDRRAFNAIYDGHLRGPWQLSYRVMDPRGMPMQVSEQGTLLTSANGDTSLLICVQSREPIAD